MVYTSRVKESYFRVSAELHTVDYESDNDGQPTSSETLRKKGRHNMGRKKLIPFSPMDLYHEETVEENMVNLDDDSPGQSKDGYFKILSS